MSPSFDQPQAVPEHFVPTPERLSGFSFLELKQEEARDLLMSVQGRKELLERILPHATDIKNLHPDFDLQRLPKQLEEVSLLMNEHTKLFEAANSKEKKSLFQRAIQTIKEFPKNHPFLTAILGIALLTAGLIRLGYIKLPNFSGGFGFGQSGGGALSAEKAADATANALGAAENAVGQQEAAALPELFQRAIKAAEALSPGPNDFIVADRQILFGGNVYDASNLESLAEALQTSEIGNAATIRILRDSSARVTAWQNLQSFLVNDLKIPSEKVVLVKDLLQSPE